MEEETFFPLACLGQLVLLFSVQINIGQSVISCHLWRKVIRWSNKTAADMIKAESMQ